MLPATTPENANCTKPWSDEARPRIVGNRSSSRSVTLGVIWAAMGGRNGVLFWLYLLATAVLFFGVPWSKFAHMFFKPAAAFEKRVSRANGTAENLPTLTRDDPGQQARHSMELLRNAPMDMGLGIKREAPRHY